MTTTGAIDHPAKFSQPVLDAIRSELRKEADRRGMQRLHVVDVFAGVGRIHELLGEFDTVGVELEPEWAHAHERTVVGDATSLPASWSGLFDAVATSPVYPNRMSDTYDGKGKCRTCQGTGTVRSGGRGCIPVTDSECLKCAGTGVDQSKRYTYRIYLGRMPSPGSACVMKWGPEYRNLHLCALIEMVRVVREDGLLLINMSNHLRTVGAKGRRQQVEVEVVEWWLGKVLELGCRVDAVLPIETSRMGNGANGQDRAETEKLLVLRTPVERRLAV
jgi:hypothetical protein